MMESSGSATRIRKVRPPAVTRRTATWTRSRSRTVSRAALEIVRPFVGHVHLKGLEDGKYCEFGVGDVDLGPTLRSLIEQGYEGGFSVEYEGPHDGTLRLYESVHQARAVIEELSTT